MDGVELDLIDALHETGGRNSGADILLQPGLVSQIPSVDDVVSGVSEVCLAECPLLTSVLAMNAPDLRIMSPLSLQAFSFNPRFFWFGPFVPLSSSSSSHALQDAGCTVRQRRLRGEEAPSEWMAREPRAADIRV